MNATQVVSAITTYGPYVIVAAAAAATVLPKPVPGTVYAGILGVINALALNFGNAANKA